MPLRELERLFGKSTTHRYQKGQILLHAGEELDSFFYVKKGYVKMYGITDLGEERILLIFYPRSIFPIFPNRLKESGHMVNYFYQSMTNLEVYKISAVELTKVLDTNKSAAQAALEYVTDMAADLISRLGIIENKNAKAKIANLLQYLVKTCATQIKPDRYQVNFKITQQDIASLTGLTRETASIQINQLEKDGVIIKGKGQSYVIYKSHIPS